VTGPLLGSPCRWKERALKLCEDNNVLVVAAAGNDGCDCFPGEGADCDRYLSGVLDVPRPTHPYSTKE
jgi:hypothetical protein